MRSRRRAQDTAAEARERVEAAMQQLERAELYVVAAQQLLIDDPEHRRLLEDLRAQVDAVRRTLDRPPTLTIAADAG